MAYFILECMLCVFQFYCWCLISVFFFIMSFLWQLICSLKGTNSVVFPIYIYVVKGSYLTDQNSISSFADIFTLRSPEAKKKKKEDFWNNCVGLYISNGPILIKFDHGYILSISSVFFQNSNIRFKFFFLEIGSQNFDWILLK